MVMEGYWNDPERTAEVLDGQGWFRSGDIARQDEDGYLYIVGRARDIIVTGRTADNVYSRLLDDFLTAQPAVKDAAAIGLPGDDGKETVHVVLVPQDPASPPDLPRLTREISDASETSMHPTPIRSPAPFPGRPSARPTRTPSARPCWRTAGRTIRPTQSSRKGALAWDSEEAGAPDCTRPFLGSGKRPDTGSTG
jgi:fatty-acyl-CoA synthase